MLVTAAAVSLAAQDPPRTFETAVNYVRVDMYPLAGDKPVTDLRAEEVELLEDGAPQKIEQFEHVQIAGRRPQTLRPEPSTMAEMQRALKDPRARVFVLFLDPRHVDGEGSMNVRRPLIDALNSLVGGDDVIAVMTPEMSPRDITFTRAYEQHRRDAVELLGRPRLSRHERREGDRIREPATTSRAETGSPRG